MEGNPSAEPKESWDRMVIIQGKQIISGMGRRTRAAVEVGGEDKVLGRAEVQEVPVKLCKTRVGTSVPAIAWPSEHHSSHYTPTSVSHI